MVESTTTTDQQSRSESDATLSVVQEYAAAVDAWVGCLELTSRSPISASELLQACEPAPDMADFVAGDEGDGPPIGDPPIGDPPRGELPGGEPPAGDEGDDQPGDGEGDDQPGDGEGDDPPGDGEGDDPPGDGEGEDDDDDDDDDDD